MIGSFLTQTIVIKKPKTLGNKTRFTSTATIDGNIQLNSTNAEEKIGSEYGTSYFTFFDIEYFNILKKGNIIINKDTGIEYMVDHVEAIENPLSGTSYVEVSMTRTQTKLNNTNNV